MKNNDCYRCLNEDRINLCVKCKRFDKNKTDDKYRKKPMFKGLDFDYEVK